MHNEDLEKERLEYEEKLREHPPHLSRSKGLGDTIAKITKKVGIKPCGGCNKRRDKLNRLFPYEEEPKKEG